MLGGNSNIISNKKIILENEMNDQFCFIPLKLFNHAKISQLSRFLLESKILILNFQTPLRQVLLFLNTGFVNNLNQLTLNVLNMKFSKHKGQFIKMTICANNPNSFLLSSS